MSGPATMLAEGLACLNLALSATVRQRLLDYLVLVQKWNKVYNLTAVRDSDKMLTHHLLDSLAVVPHLQTAKTLLDVGSGAGLPGIPLALALPQMQVTLLDSNHKKCAFLKQALIELTLGNAQVICERVEKLQAAQRFDVVISRAFSDLPMFADRAGHLVAPHGVMLAMKGVQPSEEIAQLNGNFRLSGIAPLRIPGLCAERHLVFLKAA